MKPVFAGLAIALLLLAALPLRAADSLAPTSHGLLVRLQEFMQERGAHAEDLTAREAVRLMIDWYRFDRTQAADGNARDTLEFRYGGWSEGCATAFNLSLLRKLANANSQVEAVAGVTLMFEPSSQVELKAYSDSIADPKSLESFLRDVEASPAFKLLGDARPMSALLESGGLR